MTGTTPPPPAGEGGPGSRVVTGARDDLLVPSAEPWSDERRDRTRSRWVLVTALVAAVVVLGALGLGAVKALRSATESSASSAGSAAIGTLPVGTCYRLPTDERSSDSVGTVETTPCTEPHDGQVYAHVPLAFDDYPSDAALTTAAESGCGDADSTLDPSVASSDVMSPSWYAPLEADWADSPHSATCVVESNDPDGLTRSWVTS